MDRRTGFWMVFSLLFPMGFLASSLSIEVFAIAAGWPDRKIYPLSKMSMYEKPRGQEKDLAKKVGRIRRTDR